MRILVVQNELNLSGAPICAYALVKHLASQGNQVFVVAPGGGEQVADYQKIGVQCIADPTILNDSRSSYNLAKQVDLVIAFTTLSYNVVYGAKGAGKPVIFSIHEVDQVGVNLARENKIVRKALDLADAVVFNCDNLRSKFSPYMRKRNSFVIPMGFEQIDTTGWDKLDTTYKNLVIVGSIEPRKNQLMAIETVKANEKVHLTVIGRTLDAVYANNCRVAAKDCARIVFKPSVNKDEIQKEIYKHDGLLLTSKDETQSLVIPEALNLGIPVIASNIGGHYENVHAGKSGFLFNVNSLNDLQKHIDLFCVSDANALGKYGQNFIREERSMELYTSRYSKIISKLFGN